MTGAAHAIKKEIAWHKRQLARLDRAYDIVTGKRGIEGAPAESGRTEKKEVKKKETARKPEPEQAASASASNGSGRRIPGELEEEVRTLMMDGKPRTPRQVMEDLNLNAFEHLYELLERFSMKKAGIKRVPQEPVRTYKFTKRETIVRPGEGVRVGRLKD